MKLSLPRLLLLGITVPAIARAETFSLAEDFSPTENHATGSWSYRTDDGAELHPVYPLLPSAARDANALWGSDFPNPPMMWSDATGYWGIGRNTTGSELYSSRNETPFPRPPI